MISIASTLPSLFLGLSIWSSGQSNDGPIDLSRPLADEGPTVVKIAALVLDIDDVDSANQSFEANLFFQFHWNDPRLAHDGRILSMPLSSVWNPGLQIVNQQRLQYTPSPGRRGEHQRRGQVPAAGLASPEARAANRDGRYRCAAGRLMHDPLAWNRHRPGAAFA